MGDIISSITIKGNVPAIRYYTMEKVNEIKMKEKAKNDKCLCHRKLY